jgi:hypothetical protein
MNKVVYLNSHLEKFRKEPEIKIKLEDLEGLSRYPNLLERDKKTTKIFVIVEIVYSIIHLFFHS